MLMPTMFRGTLFDNFFDDFDRSFRPQLRKEQPTMHPMKTDIKEKADGYELTVDLPGYNKEDVTAELEDGYLTIKVSKEEKNETKDEDGNFIRKERYCGSCARSFYVGETVTQEDITAKFENGCLQITVPKKEITPEVEQKKYIQIAG